MAVHVLPICSNHSNQECMMTSSSLQQNNDDVIMYS